MARIVLKRKQKGVAAVEMGLVLIPLVLLVFGITEFGRAIYQYNAIAKATRDGVRYLSGRGPGMDHDAATNLVVCGQTDACGSASLVPGLTAAMVSICDAVTPGCEATHASQPTGVGVVNLVSVTVSGYQFTSLLPFIVPSMTFSSIATTMRQAL